MDLEELSKQEKTIILVSTIKLRAPNKSPIVGGFLQPGGGLHPPNPKCRMSLGTAKECSI